VSRVCRLVGGLAHLIEGNKGGERLPGQKWESKKHNRSENVKRAFHGARVRAIELEHSTAERKEKERGNLKRAPNEQVRAQCHQQRKSNLKTKITGPGRRTTVRQ